MESAPGPIALLVRQAGRVHRLSCHPGETLLECMRRHGINAPSSCEQGICGTCMVRRHKGAVRLRQNHILSDEDLAQGYTLACQGEPAEAQCEIEIEG
jgi:3-ketosteroid 9alpha-monooxygenase subunit B